MENNKIIKYQNGLVQHVSNSITITSKLLSINLRPLNILVLDDHLIFFKGISHSKCLLKSFPNSIFKNIQNLCMFGKIQHILYSRVASKK